MSSIFHECACLLVFYINNNNNKYALRNEWTFLWLKSVQRSFFVIEVNCEPDVRSLKDMQYAHKRPPHITDAIHL